MALKKEGTQISLKAPSGNVPYVPGKSYASIAFDSFKPTLDRLQTEADQTAQANYFQDFQIKTRDQFEKFRNEFSMDPDKMKAATDTYSKTLLDSVPAAYKIQANAMLSAYSQNSIIYASSRKKEFDNNKLISDRDTKWNNFNTEAEFSMRNFNNQELDLAITGINKQFKNNLLQINEISHEDYENLVLNNGLIREKDHVTNIRNQAEALMTARGFHIMMSLYNNGQEVEALNYLNDFMNNQDAYEIERDSEFENNPMLNIVDNLYQDDDDRARIGNNILKKYKAFHRDAIYGKQKKPNINLDAFKEPGRALSLENFKGGDVSMDEILTQIPVEIGSNKYFDLLDYVNNANRIQSIVSKTMQNEDRIYKFESDDDKEMWAKAILANQNPPIYKIQYSDVNTDSFKTAINLFAKQDYFPEELRKVLQLSDAGSFKDEGTLNDFKDKALMYQYVSNDELFPDVEYNPLYQKAIDSGVLESIVNQDYNRASSVLESLQNENLDVKLTNIEAQYDDGNKAFELFYNKQLNSPHFLLKYFANEKDPLHKSLFAQSDQTTWIAWEPSKIIPPEIQTKVRMMWNEELASMTVGENPDIWSKQNGRIRSKAFNRVMKRLQDEGYGIETNTSDGKPKLVRNPFWQRYGTLNNNDVYAAIKEDFIMLNKNEQLSKYDTNKWEEVEGYFRQWADNKNGNVKIAIDRNNTKDETGFYSYKLTMHIGDDMVTLDKNYKPTAWTNLTDFEAPSSNAQIVNHTTNKIFEAMQKSKFFNNDITSKSLSLITNTPMGTWDMDEKNTWTKRAIYSVIRNGIKLSDFRFYPDVPGIDDTPMEIRPFAWIARMMGFKGDLREIRTELQTAASYANKNLSYQKKINLSRDLSDAEKITESALPPEETVMSRDMTNRNLKQWAIDNYQNEDYRLTHRTNNWTAVSSAGWDGELDITYTRGDRRFAIFAKPKDSIRAAVKTIINHSTLTSGINEVDKRYGSEPTFEEIFKMYAEDNESYLQALENKTNFDRNDKINLMNANEMHRLLKFIVQHEMGKDYYLDKFGSNSGYVNSVIFQGFNEAINSYNGELGKL